MGYEAKYANIIHQLLHKCLTIRGIECNFSINDCLLTPKSIKVYLEILQSIQGYRQQR